MSGNFLRFLLIVLIGGALIIGSSVFFTVREDQQAMVLQFGAPVGGAINEPGQDEAGLKFKLPFIQNVVYFDRKNLEFDGQPEEIIVANEERLLVDAFVRYRIVDPLLYFQTLGATGDNPQFMRNNFNNRISNILNEAMREQLGSRTISQVINTERASAMSAIAADVTAEARKLGVNIIDVRIRQADFPVENAVKVYERMNSDYNQQAERIRAEGERDAREIRATADKEVIRIRAVAEERAQVIRGRADAIRNCIFANAYQGIPAVIAEVAADESLPVREIGDVSRLSDEEIAAILGVTCDLRAGSQVADGDRRREFFEFYRSLLAYEASLKDEGTTIIMSPDTEFFRYFNAPSGQPG